MESKEKRDKILENYQYPSNKEIPDDDSYIKETTKNFSCVDNIDLYVKVNDEVIEDIKFDGEACAIATSSCSIISKEFKGKNIKAALLMITNYERMIDEKPYDDSVLGELNLYDEVYKQPSRKGCALIGIESLKKILKNL